MGIRDRSSRIISAFIFTRLRTPLSQCSVSHPKFRLSETFLQTPCHQCRAFELQCLRLFHTLSRPQEGEGEEEQVRVDREASAGSAKSSSFDASTWKSVDSRVLGIRKYMIPIATWMVLKRLRRKGFEAYLVGGCVRDLLSKRIPKDFDVITTAQLKQIHQIFHRSNIVGHRFPICLVNVRGSLVEVSSFDTAAKHGKQNDSNHLPTLLGDFDKKDFVRWRNSMDRDFTINSLFFDPFVDKIYDYNNGIRDLRLRKVKTVSPAQSSFEEDCARILRGLRIAARLGLTFSKETAAAIQNLYLSIMDLSKNRLMMELNYMLSYGAAESSIRLLKRYKVLDILLPVHAAYLNQQIHRESTQSSYMLLKLFSCVDKLLACDRPSHCSLWVGLLAFHLALVNKPQDAVVVWAFSSVLYHGQWNKAVEFARKQAHMPVKFSPEILEGSLTKSDNDLAEEVTCFASHVVSSISSLTKEESLLESMSKYSLSPCLGVVLVSNGVAQTVAKLFNALLENIESYAKERVSVEIDYGLLSKGNVDETRFVLGKVIMDTMRTGVVQEQKPVMAGENLLRDSSSKLLHKLHKEKHHTPSVSVKHQRRKSGEEQEMVEKDKILDSSLEQEKRPEVNDREPLSCLFGDSDGEQVMVDKEKVLESSPKQEPLPDSLSKLLHRLHKEKHHTPSVDIKHRRRKSDQDQQMVDKDKIIDSSLKQEKRPELKCREPLSSLFGDSDEEQVMVDKEKVLECSPKPEQKAEENRCKPLSSLFV